MAGVSILILTKNEEINIRRCLESVSWADDVVVYDSFSEDCTVKIAQEMGVRVEQRIFDNYAAQRNAALALDYQHDWILMVDADECVSVELKDEILEKLDGISESTALFQMRRKDHFFGRWIKHASGYPTWFGRLIRKGRVRVEREINEEYHADGDVGMLQEHLIHYPFSNGIAYWFDRHNRYSTMEAEALIQEVAAAFRFGDLFSPNPVIRRKALKQLAYRMPGRPVMVFFYLYIARLGILDGRPGWRYSIMRSMYEYMIDLKVMELRFRKKEKDGLTS